MNHATRRYFDSLTDLTSGDCDPYQVARAVQNAASAILDANKDEMERTVIALSLGQLSAAIGKNIAEHRRDAVATALRVLAPLTPEDPFVKRPVNRYGFSLINIGGEKV